MTRFFVAGGSPNFNGRTKRATSDILHIVQRVLNN